MDVSQRVDGERVGQLAVRMAPGKAHFEIPLVPFKKSLEHVSKLDSKTAIAVLELIHHKSEANVEAKAAIEYTGLDEDEVVP